MPRFDIKVHELNPITEEKTGNILYMDIIEAKNKARASSIIGDILRKNGIHDQYRHNYFIESIEVKTVYVDGVGNVSECVYSACMRD